MTEPQPASRREVLAFIALQDLPMPDAIRLDYPRTGNIAIDVATLASVGRWEAAFGGEFWGRPTVITPKDGRPAYRSLTRYLESWRGWNITIDADEPVKDAVDELDDSTTSRLRDIAGGDQ